MICPVCGANGAACHGSVPVRLTADQLSDIGLKPDQLMPGGTIAMADNEPKARYPRAEVAEGQKHGYLGEVEVYDPPEAEGGFSNAETETRTRARTRTETTRSTAKDSAPAAKPVSGRTGTIGADPDKADDKADDKD